MNDRNPRRIGGGPGTWHVRAQRNAPHGRAWRIRRWARSELDRLLGVDTARRPVPYTCTANGTALDWPQRQRARQAMHGGGR